MKEKVEFNLVNEFVELLVSKYNKQIENSILNDKISTLFKQICTEYKMELLLDVLGY